MFVAIFFVMSGNPILLGVLDFRGFTFVLVCCSYWLFLCHITFFLLIKDIIQFSYFTFHLNEGSSLETSVFNLVSFRSSLTFFNFLHVVGRAILDGRDVGVVLV